MLDSAGSSKTRDALLEKLKERIKERDRALEVRAGSCHVPNTMLHYTFQNKSHFHQRVVKKKIFLVFFFPPCHFDL